MTEAMENAHRDATVRAGNGDKGKRAAGIVLLSLGIALALALSAIAIVADAEATLFSAGLAHLGDASLKTIRCPAMITTGKPGTVRATFRNPLDKDVEFNIRAHISQYVPMWREEAATLHVAAGETERLAWEVTADDKVQGNLVLVKVLRYRKYPLPALLGSCGILVVDLPYLTGNQITALVVVACLLCLVGGVTLWILGSRPLRGPRQATVRAMSVLAGVGVAGMVLSLLGAWMLGIIFFAATLLLAGAVIGHHVNRLRRESG